MLSDLYIRRRRSLVALLTGLVGNPDTAEDLTQEAFVRVCRAVEAGQIGNPDAFLYRTARNLGLDHHRQRRRRGRVERAGVEVADIAAEGATPEERLLERQRRVALGRAMARLPPRAVRAWQLAHAGGLTYARIAEILGVSRNTVYNDVKLVVGHCHDTLRRLEGG